MVSEAFPKQKSHKVEIYLERSMEMWYFMGRLLIRLSYIPHASGLLAGCPKSDSEGLRGIDRRGGKT